MTDLQVALSERDKIIQDLTDSLKQSFEVRDQLNERNERLLNETRQLRAASVNRKKWIDTHDEQRLSETTIDLVSESEFEDEDFFNRTAPALFEKQLEQMQTKETSTIPSDPYKKAIDDFKGGLTDNESVLFAKVQENFEKMLKDEMNDLKEKLYQEQMEKNELESEVNRVNQLLTNVKNGSAEFTVLRSELDKIHKKEMENLRMYFEQKCTDLEKQ